jgi:hypothetical protein
MKIIITWSNGDKDRVRIEKDAAEKLAPLLKNSNWKSLTMTNGTAESNILNNLFVISFEHARKVKFEGE